MSHKKQAQNNIIETLVYIFTKVMSHPKQAQQNKEISQSENRK